MDDKNKNILNNRDTSATEIKDVIDNKTGTISPTIAENSTPKNMHNEMQNNSIKKFAVIAIFCAALILIFFVIGIVVFKNLTDYGVPHYVDSKVSPSYYLSENTNTITGVTWNNEINLAKDLNEAPFIDTDDVKWGYYKIGSKTNTDGTGNIDFYISTRKVTDFTLGKYFIGVQNGVSTIYTLLSPDEYDFASLHLNEAPTNTLSSDFSSYIKEGVIIDTKTVVEGSTPPLTIDINSIQLEFAGYTEFYRSFYKSYPISNDVYDVRLLASTENGQLYEEKYKEFGKPESTNNVQYILYLNNRTRVLYKLRNDYNKSYIDQIKLKDSNNNYRYGNSPTDEKCLNVRASLNATNEVVHSVYSTDPSKLVKIGRYPDFNAIYTSDELNIEFYEYYRKIIPNLSSEIPEINSYEEFVSYNPTLLIDSSLGYYYVYYNIDLLNARDSYSCKQ